jgi:glycosyltransferase involved in cell wall biosynthesis
MRILVALTYYRPHYSGLTIYTELAARALAERGHQVTILTSRFDPSLPPHEIRDGVEVIRPRVWFHLSKGVVMPSMLIWAWRLARQADIVHLHVPQLDAALIALVARLLKKPVVLTYHCDLRLPDGLVHKAANLASNLANRITAQAANVIVANTQENADVSPLLQHYLKKLNLIYPPVKITPITEVDQGAFRQKHDIQPGQRIIGMAARLAAEKGVEYLVEALPGVLERFPQARVLFVGPYTHVVGEAAYARRIIPMIEQLGKHWTFLGIVSPVEMSAFFHECEVTVLPSINSTESYGLVQVESMFCGTPVVASDLPGVRVPVTQTGMGLIVPPADPQALAEALINILSDPAAYRGQPERLLSLSTPESVAEQYEAIFTAQLANKNLRVEEAQERRGT